MNQQSNTQLGPFPILAGDALTGKEGHLVKIGNDGGTAKAYLPDAVTDLALHVVVEGAAAGSLATVQPLAHAQQARAELEGAVAIGTRLRLYTPDGTNDGKVATIGTAAGLYFSPGIALETGADGQLVLFQPDPQLVIVPAAAIADPTGGTTADAEARAAIASIIDALQAVGIVAAS